MKRPTTEDKKNIKNIVLLRQSESEQHYSRGRGNAQSSADPFNHNFLRVRDAEVLRFNNINKLYKDLLILGRVVFFFLSTCVTTSTSYRIYHPNRLKPFKGLKDN